MEAIRLSEAAGLLLIAWIILLLGWEELIQWRNNKKNEK